MRRAVKAQIPEWLGGVVSLDHGQMFCGDGLRCRSADRALAHGFRCINSVGERLREVVLDIKLNQFPVIHSLSMYPVSLLGLQAPRVPSTRLPRTRLHIRSTGLFRISVPRCFDLTAVATHFE